MPRRAGFLDPMETRQFPGSSGYWATSGTNAVANQNLFAGGGRPGDAARFAMNPTSRYPGVTYNTRTPAPTSGSAALYEPIAITKNPWLKDFVGSLQTDLNKASSTMPDFSKILADMQSSRSGINTSFDRYSDAMNLDDYIAAQRGGDAELRGRTDMLAGDVAGLSNRYGDVLADYERRGQGALDTELANARDFSDRLIPQAVQDAYSQVQKNAKLYDFATPGGYSSGLAGKIASESTRAALPFMLEGSRYTGNVLAKQLPFASDVASRQSNKITGFDYPAASQMYDRYGNVIGQEKATAANIQQMQMAVAREGVDMAIRRHVTDFQSAQMLAQAANLPVQVIMERAQAAGVLGGMSPLYQYEDVEYLPGANVRSPSYFNNSLPGYPQSRYGNTTTSNSGGGGGGGGGGNRYTADPRAAGSGFIPDWMQGLTPAQLQAYDRNMTGQRQAPGLQSNTDGGWGYVNQNFIGQDADWWNNALSGTL